MPEFHSQLSGFWKSKGENSSKMRRAAFSHRGKGGGTKFAQGSRGAAISPTLALAFGAEVGSAAGDDDTANWRLAAAAGLARAQIDAVLELEESTLAIGAHIV